MKRIALFAALALVFAAPRVSAQALDVEGARPEGGAARAQTGTSPAARAPRPAAVRAHDAAVRQDWYGWQTLVSDGIALSLLGAAAATDSEQLGQASLGVYALGAPAIHAANGEVGRGFASLGVRTIAPFAGLLSGLFLGVLTLPKGGAGDGCAKTNAYGECIGDDGTSEGLEHLATFAVGGLVLGFIGASAFDGAVIARRDARARPAFAVAPSLAPLRQGATFGFVGAF